MQGWASQGLDITILNLVINNSDGSAPAVIDAASTWKQNFGIDSAYVAPDPTYAMVPPGQTTIGTPMITVIDPRTMLVVSRSEGWSGNHNDVVALAMSNQ